MLVTRIADGSGHARVPEGALVEGRVTDLGRGEGVSAAHVALSIERLCGQPLRARVVDPPLEQVPHERNETAIEGATFAWLLIGSISFGLPGLMLGSTTGGATGATQKTRGRTVEGWLAAGTEITIEVDEATPLQRCLRA
jgi:hypothetical protein